MNGVKRRYPVYLKSHIIVKPHINSCFSVGYREISVKIFFRSYTGKTSENTDFHVLVA